MKSATASSVVVEGLGELTAEQARERLLQARLDSEKSEKAKERETRKREKRLAKLIAFRDGVIDTKINPKGHHNPQLLPETLRPASEGEMINGLPAKGWVVTIVCETCGEEREINTQDSFQVRFCEAHKAEASKAKAKERRTIHKRAKVAKELDGLTDEQVAEELAQLTADLAA
jgi:hypothetical protein